MKTELLFLGTGAADWDYKNDYERSDFRGFSGILIDGHIMIDCGIGAFLYEDRFSLSGIYKNVDTVFMTHSHDDHFRAECVSRLCGESEKKITLYGDKIFEKLLPKEENLSFVPLDARFYESCTVGGYKVTALKSNHATTYPEEQTLHYFFEGEKNMFIGYDGGWLIAETWSFLQKKHVDVYIVDATCGDDFECTYNFRNFSHNNIPMIDYMVKTMKVNGIADDDTQVILHHLARTLHPTHEEVCEKEGKKGYIVSYDGMKYTF